MSFTGVINSIYAFCQNAMQLLGYPGLALVMFLENVFPPIPSEIVLPLAGTLTVSSDPSVAPEFNIVSVILWATLCRCVALVLDRLSDQRGSCPQTVAENWKDHYDHGRRSGSCT